MGKRAGEGKGLDNKGGGAGCSETHDYKMGSKKIHGCLAQPPPKKICKDARITGFKKAHRCFEAKACTA